MAESKRLADLIAASAYAPTYGLNSRELLLQAARLRNVEEDFTFEKKTRNGPTGRPQPGRGQVCTTPATGESAATLFIHAESLCTGIPVKETPTVGWNPKSKVPRGERLSVLNRLVGEHLALELHAEGLPLIPDSVARYDTVRHRAIARAVQQEEMEIYKLCTGRPSYIAVAARVSARLPSPPAANPSVACTAPSARDASPAPVTLHEELFGSPEGASLGPSAGSSPPQGISPERGRNGVDTCTKGNLFRSHGDPASAFGKSAMPDDDVAAGAMEHVRGFGDDSGMREDDEAGPRVFQDIALPPTSDKVQIEGVSSNAGLPFSLAGGRVTDASHNGDGRGSNQVSCPEYPDNAPGSAGVLLPFDLTISPAELLDAILKATGGVSTPAAQAAEAGDASNPAAQPAEAQKGSGSGHAVPACNMEGALHAVVPDQTVPAAACDQPSPTGGAEVTQPTRTGGPEVTEPTPSGGPEVAELGPQTRETSHPAAWDQALSSTGLDEATGTTPPDEASPAAVPNEGMSAGGTEHVPKDADVDAKEAGSTGLPATAPPSGAGGAAPVAAPREATPPTRDYDVIPPSRADEAGYVHGVGAQESTPTGPLIDQAVLPALGEGGVPEAGGEEAPVPAGLDSGLHAGVGLCSSESTFAKTGPEDKQWKNGDCVLQEDTGSNVGQSGEAQARTFENEVHADLEVCGASGGALGEVAASALSESGRAHVDLDALGHADMDSSAKSGRATSEGRKRQMSQEAAHDPAAQSCAMTVEKDAKRRRFVSETRSLQRADRDALEQSKQDHRKQKHPSVAVVPGYEIPDGAQKGQDVAQGSVPAAAAAAAAAAAGPSVMPELPGTAATVGQMSFHGPMEQPEAGGGWVAPPGAHVDAGGPHVGYVEAPQLPQEAIPPPPPGFIPPLPTEALPPLPPEPPEWENMGAGIHGGGGTSIGGAVSRGVGDAVLRYVRSILDPLYAAEVISKDVYKKVAKKAVDKVMRSHADAPDATFLVREGVKIQVLVQQYVELYMNQPAPPG